MINRRPKSRLKWTFLQVYYMINLVFELYSQYIWQCGIAGWQKNIVRVAQH